MRRLPGRNLLLPLLVFFIATSALAQIYFPPPVFPPRIYYPRPYNPPTDPRDAPVEIGGYAALGGAIEESPVHRSGVFISSAGLYAQWNRFGFCPGIDLRIQGDSSSLHGYLVGPRVAYQPKGHYRPFRFYAEGLFGKNEVPASFATDAVLITPTGSRVGVTRAGVIGLDLHSDESAFSWRVIEFSKGDFTGLSGSYPQTVTTGIVFHFP